MVDWRQIDDRHYSARFDSGIYHARFGSGEWSLWFKAHDALRFARKPGSWKHLADAKQRAAVFDNDKYLQRS